MNATITGRASNVRPLAQGPVSTGEALVLDAIALTGSTPHAITAATGLDEQTVETALAQLSRRGLVRRTASHARRVSGRPAPRRRALRLIGDSDPAGQPTPPLPAA
jgi:DNA-binding MarR family transcriptional regulator